MLFPHCDFEVLLPDGVVRAATRVDGTLVVRAREPIPRAEEVDIVYKVVAWAGYGAGKSRQVVRRTVFDAPLHAKLAGVLPAGTSRFPFAIDVPAWVPPGIVGADCAIEHRMRTRLDVDWAIDPKSVLEPPLVMQPRHGVRRPTTMRSPAGFHDEILLEVSLVSSVIAEDERLEGNIALRAGHDARFDAIVLAFVNVTTVAMGRGEERRGAGLELRIPAKALRSGEPVPFAFSSTQGLVPSFRSPFLVNDARLFVRVDIPWSRDPELAIPVDVLPRGSLVQGDGALNLVGGARLRTNAAAMAARAGLAIGTPPILVEGEIGAVRVRLVDAPRAGQVGIDAELVFPPVDLGLRLRPLGLLDGLRDSSLLPPALRDRFYAASARVPGAPEVDAAAIATFLEELVRGLESADDLAISDHHLSARYVLADDDGARMTAIAAFFRAKAESVARAIAALPFPAAHPSSAAAWRACAAEQSALLVPTGPAIHGLRAGARLLGGEERSVAASIATAWSKDGPVTRVEIDLRDAPVPAEAAARLERESGDDLARALLRLLPSAHATETALVLERPGFTADPRELLPAIDAALAWALAARGERRADSPYR